MQGEEVEGKEGHDDERWMGGNEFDFLGVLGDGKWQTKKSLADIMFMVANVLVCSSSG